MKPATKERCNARMNETCLDQLATVSYIPFGSRSRRAPAETQILLRQPRIPLHQKKAAEFPESVLPLISYASKVLLFSAAPARQHDDAHLMT